LLRARNCYIWLRARSCYIHGPGGGKICSRLREEPEDLGRLIDGRSRTHTV